MRPGGLVNRERGKSKPRRSTARAKNVDVEVSKIYPCVTDKKFKTHTHTRYTREIYDIFIYAHTLYIDLLNTHTRNKRETSHETYLLRIQKRYTRDTIDLLDIRTPTIDS